MSEPRAGSVVIVGAGVSGLSVAYQLQQSGYSVTVLDRGEVGAESSWAGGGILAPLMPWDYAPALNRLALRSMARYSTWAHDIEKCSGVSPEYIRSGMHVFGLDTVAPAQAWCAAHGLAAEVISTAVGDALALPDIAQVRNPCLVNALRDAVIAGGGVIHTDCAAESVQTTDCRVLSVMTSRGPVAADRFVLATGAWAGCDLPGLAGIPNVRPIRGQMLLFKLAPGALGTILYCQGLYVIPRRDGHVLVGSTVEDVGFDTTIDTATRERLHRDAARLFPALGQATPIRHWAGLRPGAPDNVPVIDRHPLLDNLYVNVGHFRYGVTLAPASAELLVDLMEGTTPAIDPEPYRWSALAARHWPDTERP